MATSGANIQTAQPTALCDYCNQKPKFSNHKYCSKTCAGQAATLCNHCHKKPKFQNFEYCGKNCANAASPGVKTRNATGGASQAQASGAAKGPNYPKGNNYNVQNQKQAQPAFDPVQIAKLVVQHIPQVQAMITTVAQAGNGAGGTTTQSVAPSSRAAPNPPVNNPFLNSAASGSQVAPTVGTTNGTLATSSNALPAAQPLNISTQSATDNLECIIPGCGKPVHVDSKGVKTSDYCSTRHREEAVVSGLVSPCIMCLSLPQSEVDYFCSKTCREDAMSKEFAYVDIN